MRTTLTLDDDVLAFARERAQHERVSLGEAISRLVRAGIQAQGAASASTHRVKSKFALLPARREIISTQHVRELMDQEGV
jgi:hypothetical protein